MATSGNSTLKIYDWASLEFSWQENSQSVADNTTTIGWKLELVTGNGTLNLSNRVWEVYIDGKKYSGTSNIKAYMNSTLQIASGTATVSHNSDGSKTFPYSYMVNFDAWLNNGKHMTSYSGSGSGTLDTIPRKSTLAVGNGTLGVEQTLVVTKESSSFTHTIRCAIGEDYWTICNKETKTSIAWTPPIERASYNTTGSTISMVFTIITYNGNTEIGSNKYTRTFAIPLDDDECKPTMSISVFDPEGHKDTYGYFVKGLSKCKVTVDADPAYGSPISSYSVTINGVRYSSNEVTTGVILDTEDISVSVAVTDKRGATNSWSGSYNVLDYFSPVISSMSVRRCDEDGTANDEGSFVIVTFSAAVSALRDGNTSAYVLGYKKSTETTYTTFNFSNLKDVYTVTGATHIFAADVDFPYDVEVAVADKHGTYTRKTSASTAFALMNWHPGGKGIGVGMVSESTGFSVGMGMKLYGGIESVAVNKAKSSRNALGIGKHLWGTGDWSDSNPAITVEEIQNYTLLRLKVKGVNANILAFNNGGNLRGMGGYAESNRHRTYSISAVVDGTTLTLTVCSLILHTGSGSHSAPENVSISDIWGIF